MQRLINYDKLNTVILKKFNPIWREMSEVESSSSALSMNRETAFDYIKMEQSTKHNKIETEGVFLECIFQHVKRISSTQRAQERRQRPVDHSIKNQHLYERTAISVLSVMVNESFEYLSS